MGKIWKIAGMIRNQDIIDTSDYIIAFWDGVQEEREILSEELINVRRKYRVIWISIKNLDKLFFYDV